MKLRYLKALLILPLVAACGCPSRSNGCTAGIDNSHLIKWEHKQDVKWNRFMRDTQHRFQRDDS